MKHYPENDYDHMYNIDLAQEMIDLLEFEIKGSVGDDGQVPIYVGQITCILKPKHLLNVKEAIQKFNTDRKNMTSATILNYIQKVAIPYTGKRVLSFKTINEIVQENWYIKGKSVAELEYTMYKELKE